MTTQNEFGAVLEALPVERLDYRSGYYSRDSVKTVAWVKATVVCEAEMPMQLRSVCTPELACAFWREVVAKNPVYDPEKESFAVLFLNRKNMISGWNLVSLGTQNTALAHPREVLRAALVANASGFLCMHNHPSGDPAPSAPDMHVTRMIREAAKAVNVPMIDHVIVGEAANDPLWKGFFSFRNAGII